MVRAAIVPLLLKLVPAAIAPAEKCVALLIGNQTYRGEIGLLYLVGLSLPAALRVHGCDRKARKFAQVLGGHDAFII